MKKVFIVGCGHIGKRVARQLLSQGTEVTALARSEEGRSALEAEGIDSVVGDLDFPESLKGLQTKDATVFYFAPPPGGGHIDPRMRNFCAAIPEGEAPSKIVYISTSGVYGDRGGEWVSEEDQPNPQTTRSRRRLDAETVLRGWGQERGVAAVVLRVTGIYGPEWLPLARIQGGHPVLKREEAPLTNRIHADDLVQVAIAAGERGEAGEVYNVSDGHPTTMTEYFFAAADLFGLPRPREVSMEEARQVMNPMMLSYLSESRRLDNRRMLDRLGITLRYPTLEAGLAAIKEALARGEGPGGMHN